MGTGLSLQMGSLSLTSPGSNSRVKLHSDQSPDNVCSLSGGRAKQGAQCWRLPHQRCKPGEERGKGCERQKERVKGGVTEAQGTQEQCRVQGSTQCSTTRACSAHISQRSFLCSPGEERVQGGNKAGNRFTKWKRRERTTLSGESSQVPTEGTLWLPTG